MTERGEIWAGLERSETCPAVAASMGRPVSGVSSVAPRWPPWLSGLASPPRCRPTSTALEVAPQLMDRLGQLVTEWHEEWWSLDKIAPRRRIELPDHPMMWVSHGTHLPVGLGKTGGVESRADERPPHTAFEFEPFRSSRSACNQQEEP